MLIESTTIPGLLLLKPERRIDPRGYFTETFRADQFQAMVGPFAFVQENQSFSRKAGTVRGLHFQLAPRAQGKLVSCIAGSLLDVAVDLRKGSPAFGRSVAVVLSEENGHQLWVPPGFAHGFCTLKDQTSISYRVTDYYSPDHDRGLQWNDPALAIEWPVAAGNAILSDRDQRHPNLSDLHSNFVFSP